MIELSDEGIQDDEDESDYEDESNYEDEGNDEDEGIDEGEEEEAQKSLNLISNAIFTSVGISLFTHSLSLHSTREEHGNAQNVKQATNIWLRTCELFMVTASTNRNTYLRSIALLRRGFSKKGNPSPVPIKGCSRLVARVEKRGSTVSTRKIQNI
jgi:hypothetical protein